jgi:hypothetical protein
MIRRIKRLAVVVVVIAFAEPALADDAPEAPRVSWAIGGTGGIAGATHSYNANFGVGPYVRVGYGQSDALGFEVEASVYSAIVTAVLRGALLVDLTPTDRYTVALGAVTSYGGGDDDILIVGGTARFDFHVTSSRTSSGARRGLTIGLGVDLGYARVNANGSGLGYGANFYVGYSRY